jgi:predicted nucleotidyltransferase
MAGAFAQSVESLQGSVRLLACGKMKSTKPLDQGILEEVRRLTREVLGKYDVGVYLFGSWAKGTPSRTSDIDVGVDPHSPLPPGTLAALRERLEESHVPYTVDVVDLTATDPAFRKIVLSEGIRWNG